MSASGLAGCSRWCYESVIWVVMVEVDFRKHHIVCPPSCVLRCPLKDSKKVFLGLCNRRPRHQIYLVVNRCLIS